MFKEKAEPFGRGRMDDDVPSYPSTDLPLLVFASDHLYDSRHSLVMNLPPEIYSQSAFCYEFQQTQSWTLPLPPPLPASQSPRPAWKFREIRPRPPDRPPSPSAIPTEEIQKREHEPHQVLGRRGRSNDSRQLDDQQGTAKRARRTPTGATGAMNETARDDEKRFAYGSFQCFCQTEAN